MERNVFALADMFVVSMLLFATIPNPLDWVLNELISAYKVDDWVGLNTTTTYKRATTTTVKPQSLGGVDDWAYAEKKAEYDMASSNGLGGIFTSYKMAAPSQAMAENIGFSVGGAKDVNNFRENIENGFLPLPTDITYEGLFYDYFFDTGAQRECDELFCPSYSYAVSKDPFSKKTDTYLSVGLNSGLKADGFKRTKLNLVVVLDISGSMGSPFDRYYYDRFGKRVELADGESGATKMEVATKSIAALLGHLEDDDSFGMVLYDQSAYLAKPLRRVGDTDMEKIKGHILELGPRGSTNLEAGMRMGTGMFEEYLGEDQDEYENRIIFITDAMPNTGDTSEEGLLGITKANSKNRLYATFIGVGADFNTELIEKITKIRGANYYSVHGSRDFKKRLDDEFDYMVTPLVFNLKLELDAPGYEIVKVYGSPEAQEATGELMKVNTLFPSKVEDGETRGGLVLLKLSKTGEDGSIRLLVSYEDRNGKRHTSEETVELEAGDGEYYQSTGIRKGILLVRYADLMKNWIMDERGTRMEAKPLVRPCVDYERGIVPPCREPSYLGRWERQSMPLEVSGHYAGLFRDFRSHFKSEMNALGDGTLRQELDMLDRLAGEEDG